MRDVVVAIDFETTGLSPDWGARATEVAAVALENGRVVSRFQSLMYAGVSIPPFIEALTGITNEMVRATPPAGQVMRELARFIGTLPLVAHNASFDRKFLDAELARVRLTRHNDMICSMRLARRVYPDAPNHQLGTLRDYLGLSATGRHHRAMADAEMVVRLLRRIRVDLGKDYRLRAVPVGFLAEIQAAPRRQLGHFIDRHRERHGI